MKKLLLLLFILFISCSSHPSPEEEIADITEEMASLKEETNSERTHEADISESSTESIQETAWEPTLSIGKVVEDKSYTSFTRYIDVAGLRIFVLPGVSEEFISKVAEVYALMFEQNEYIDINLRNRYFKSTEQEFVFQRIGY